jgi:chromosome segregation ATPase
MESKELTLPERAAVALGTAKHEQELIELVKKSESITVIKNVAGREQCHSALMMLRNARVVIEKIGKTAREDATQFSKAVIAEEKRLVAITQAEEVRLQEIRDAWDAAREAEKRAKEAAEANRVAAIRAKIEAFMLDAVTAAGGKSAQIAAYIDRLMATQITFEEFEELSGEAEAKRVNTLAWLEERRGEAVAREAEDARVAAEREELARLRAEQEERDRAAAAERAAQEARDRAAREAEEAARREEQRQAEEKLRAERAEHERQMAAERAEIARQQAEIEAERRRQAEAAEAKRRAEEEARAKELREAAEMAERIERQNRERKRAENIAALNAPDPTGGEWTAVGSEVRTTIKLPGAIGTGHNDEQYYGTGALIAESIMRPADAHVMAAAKDMRAALIRVQLSTEWSCMEAEIQDAVTAALAKAEYIPTQAVELQAV